MSSASAVTSPLTIAVVKPCCIGDCVMALPAIESLARAFPFAHIHAFTGRHSAPVFRASEFISRVYVAPDQLTPSRVPGLAWNLRTAGHDWVVVLDRSRLVTAAARSANPARLVTVPRTKNETRHETDLYLDAVAAAGVRTITDIPSLAPDEESHAAAAKALAGVQRPYAVIQPGGAENPGATMLDKRWQAGRYSAVARNLAERGITTVLTGSAGDAELCESIARAAGGYSLSLAGKVDLMGTAAVIEGASLYLGSDTGVSHIAAAVGTPSIVIFGPTNPLRYAPRGVSVVILAPQRSRTLPDVDLRKASTDNNRPTTSEVTVESVIEEFDRLLHADSSRP